MADKRLYENMRSVELKNLPDLPYSVDEALNNLKINIDMLGDKYKKIMVISSVPDEGKSFVTMMLWRKFAESGKSCLYIDADLRKSVMVKKYEMERMGGEIRGLSSYLAGNVGVEKVLFKTDIKNGYVIPNKDNAPRPTLLFQNGRFEKLLSDMEANFDKIIIDVPPIDVVSDGNVIGTYCDGAVLVVRAGSTNKRIVRRSVNQLTRMGCPILGFVLNRTQNRRSGYYGKKYGSYYGGYGGYGYGAYSDYYGE